MDSQTIGAIIFVMVLLTVAYIVSMLNLISRPVQVRIGAVGLVSLLCSTGFIWIGAVATGAQESALIAISFLFAGISLTTTMGAIVVLMIKKK